MQTRTLKKLLQLGLFLSLLPLLNSCIETVTEVTIPKPQLKLVVFSFLNPADSVIEVTVSRSVPTVGVLNNGVPDYVTDATVTITDGTNSAILLYDPINKVYRTKMMRAEAGKTYDLTAVAPGGFSVKATSTVPSKVNTSLQISLDSMKQTGDLPSDYFVHARWTDFPGTGDFYKIDYELEINSNWSGLRHESLQPEVPTHSDEDSDGKLMKADSGFSSSLAEGYRTGELKKVTGYLLTCDYHYYKYHETLHRYMFTNTFAEPVMVYSNIEGGLGVFGAYQTYITTINP